jgi:hypothetical protein
LADARHHASGTVSGGGPPPHFNNQGDNLIFPGALIIVPPFVSVYRGGERIRRMQGASGNPPSVVPIVGLLLMFVFSLYSLYYQVNLNGIWSSYGNQPENTPVPVHT